MTPPAGGGSETGGCDCCVLGFVQWLCHQVSAVTCDSIRAASSALCTAKAIALRCCQFKLAWLIQALLPMWTHVMPWATRLTHIGGADGSPPPLPLEVAMWLASRWAARAG